MDLRSLILVFSESKYLMLRVILVLDYETESANGPQVEQVGEPDDASQASFIFELKGFPRSQIVVRLGVAGDSRPGYELSAGIGSRRFLRSIRSANPSAIERELIPLGWVRSVGSNVLEQWFVRCLVDLF